MQLPVDVKAGKIGRPTHLGRHLTFLGCKDRFRASEIGCDPSELET